MTKDVLRIETNIEEGMDLMTKAKKEQRQSDGAVSAAQYFLLDRDFGIVSCDTSKENGENGATGASFFDIFPAKRAVREEMADYVRSFPHKILLTLCGRTPVLLVGTLAAHTGLALAVLPQGDVSPSAQMRYKAHDDELFAGACRWLANVSAPFVGFDEAERNLASALEFVAERLSLLTDLALSHDFMGVSTLSCAKVDVAFATGVMLAALAAAKRADKEQSVRAYAATEGAPTLYLEYTRTENADAAPEFLPLLGCAAARGVSLDVVCPVSEPERVQIRASLGVVELSAQGVRERHRFLEGKSPLDILPQARGMALPFPEISFD